MNEPITEISRDEFATDFDRFVHIDEVTAIAAERDDLERRLSLVREDRNIADATIGEIAAALGEPDMDPDEIAPRVAELVARVEADRAQVRQDVVDLQKAVRAYQTLDQIAVALGCPGQDYDDLPGSVEALRLQCDYLRDAAKAALGEVLRG